MADIKLVIFDMDGTLLDSMPYWQNVSRNYLESKGVHVPDDLEQRIEAMTVAEYAEYVKEQFGIRGTTDEIIKEALQTITLAYQFEIPAKAGMKKLVKEEKDAGHQVIVLTGSERSCAMAALKRTGLLRFFDQVYTADELGMSKEKPDIFQFLCQKYGVRPEEVHCYDDALYAVKAAKEAGCYVTAVYDSTMECAWDTIEKIADDQIRP